MSNANLTKPFLKWAGGKSKIVPTLIEIWKELAEENEEWNLYENASYHEPFLGSGTVYFSLKSSDQFTENTHSFLSDLNPVLITTMKEVCGKQYPKLLISLKRLHKEYTTEIKKLGFPKGLTRKQRNERYYYRKRKKMNELISKLKSKGLLSSKESLEMAAIMIFLNKTCYNGLWRVNLKGENNVPEGRYHTPNNIFQPEILTQCHKDLQFTTITHQSFTQSFESVNSGDLVYIDPPYLPLNDGEYVFTSYSSTGFNLENHISLAELASKAASNGALIIASNNDTPKVREIYTRAAKLQKITPPIFHSIPIKRTMSSRGDGRITVNELLIFMRR